MSRRALAIEALQSVTDDDCFYTAAVVNKEINARCIADGCALHSRGVEIWSESSGAWVRIDASECNKDGEVLVRYHGNTSKKKIQLKDTSSWRESPVVPAIRHPRFGTKVRRRTYEVDPDRLWRKNHRWLVRMYSEESAEGMQLDG